MKRSILIKYLVTSVALISSIIITGCGDSKDDGSSPSNEVDSTVTLSGNVIDGYVQGATVTIGNSSETTDIEVDSTVTLSGNVIDGYVQGATVTIGNSSETTDINGFWEISNIPASKNITIIAKGGTDTSTNEPFEGVLKAPVSGLEDLDTIAITPLSTLVSSVVDSGKSIDEATSTVANSLGITQETLKSDPIKLLKSGTDKQKQDAAIAIKKALVIQKMAETISKSASVLESEQHIIFDAVMDTVAATINENKTFNIVVEDTATIVKDVAVQVKEENTEVVIKNLTEKLEASANAALEVVEAVQSMKESELFNADNIDTVLEEKAKAIEKVTNSIEEAVKKIATANSTDDILSIENAVAEAVSTAKKEFDKEDDSTTENDSTTEDSSTTEDGSTTEDDSTTGGSTLPADITVSSTITISNGWGEDVVSYDGVEDSKVKITIPANSTYYIIAENSSNNPQTKLKFGTVDSITDEKGNTLVDTTITSSQLETTSTAIAKISIKNESDLEKNYIVPVSANKNGIDIYTKIWVAAINSDASSLNNTKTATLTLGDIKTNTGEILVEGSKHTFSLVTASNDTGTYTLSVEGIEGVNFLNNYSITMKQSNGTVLVDNQNTISGSITKGNINLENLTSYTLSITADTLRSDALGYYKIKLIKEQ
jgi:hypothetical protein